MLINNGISTEPVRPASALKSYSWCILVAMIAVITICGVVSLSEEINADSTTFSVDGMNYEVIGDASTPSVKVIQNSPVYSASMIRIPSSVTYEDVTYAVTQIGDNAFDGSSDIEQITVPESVTVIGDEALITVRICRIFGCTASK